MSLQRVEPIPAHEDTWRGKTFQWMGGDKFGLTEVIERAVRMGNGIVIITEEGQSIPIEQFSHMCKILANRPMKVAEDNPNARPLNPNLLNSPIDPDNPYYDAKPMPRVVPPNEIPQLQYQPPKKKGRSVLETNGQEQMSPAQKQAWDDEMARQRASAAMNEGQGDQGIPTARVMTPEEKMGNFAATPQAQPIPNATVAPVAAPIPAADPVDPVAMLLKTKKANLVTLNVELTLDIPTKGLYETITSSFDEAEDRVIDYSLNTENMDAITNAVKDAIRKYYEGQ